MSKADRRLKKIEKLNTLREEKAKLKLEIKLVNYRIKRWEEWLKIG